MVLVLLIAIGLQCTDPYIAPWFTSHGLTIPFDSDYGTLLATIIGVGGVFIALYYAAISTIAGAIYSHVPNNIRDLLAQDRISSVYIRFISILTFLAVCLLIFHTIGLEPIILATLLLLLGSGLGILAFYRLGSRAFDLFDPTVLSGRIFENLKQSYEPMQAGGYRWSDQAFQNNSQLNAQNAIGTLSTLVDFTAESSHLNGRPFTNLCKYLIAFLVEYEEAKKSIPTDSWWYEQIYVHKDWYRTGDSMTSLGHKTSSILAPKSVSNLRWIESSIVPIVLKCIEINIKNKRYTLATEVLNHLTFYAKQLAKQSQVEFAFQIIRETSASCEKALFNNEGDMATEESLETMGICDELAAMPINVLLAYLELFEGSTLDGIRKISWTSKKSIYKAGFPVHLLKQLEWLYPRLEFEENIESNIVTPPWYIMELLTMTEAENFVNTMNCLYDDSLHLYEHWSKTATTTKHPWLAAVFISSETEYWNKLDHHKDLFDLRWSSLNTDRRIDGLAWPELKPDELAKKKENRRKDLLALMSLESTLLSLVERPESHPDFAGQFLHSVGESLLNAICENDLTTVETLFKSYFHNSLIQYDNLRPKDGNSDWRNQIDLKIAVAPLLDLMDISGYVYLFSEFHEAPALITPVINEWDNYLKDDNEHQVPWLKILVAAVSLTESTFEIAHRSMIRSRWKQVAEHHLSDVERRDISRGRGVPFGRSETIIIHKSPLVRIFSEGRHGSFYDGIDIFLAKYVRQREDGATLDYSPRRRILEEDIQRNIEQYTKDTNNED
ncbi:MAG: hypothetical protein RPU35_10220 [Candidatus Sedimenticola sp. (ex Thyasira tokunagai)]